MPDHLIFDRSEFEAFTRAASNFVSSAEAAFFRDRVLILTQSNYPSDFYSCLIRRGEEPLYHQSKRPPPTDMTLSEAIAAHLNENGS